MISLCKSKAQGGYLWRKMSNNINTPNNEKLPIPSSKGDTLYFERQISNKKNAGDIYYSTLENNNWSIAENIGFPLNNQGNNFVCTILNGHQLLVGNTYKYDGSALNAGGAISKWKDTSWSIPKNLHIDGLEINSQTGTLFCSKNKNILLISIANNSKGTDIDIYFSPLLNGQHYGKPKSLGKMINSSFSEINPFLSPDEKILYFASNKDNGFGGFDIYSSHRLDSTWANWSTPINAGALYNSEADEKSFSTTESHNWAFMYGQTKNNLQYDIFYIYRKAAISVSVKGKIKIPSGYFLTKASIQFMSKSENDIFYISSIDSTNGIFAMNVLPNYCYDFHVSCPGFMDFSDSVKITQTNNYLTSNFQNIEPQQVLVPIAVGLVVNLNNVVFSQRKWDLLPISYSSLDRLANFLKLNPKVHIELGGHTDNHGDRDLNLTLSEYRVKEVRTYLIKHGVPKARITYKYYGGSLPIASNVAEETRKLNRRVDYKITKYE